MAHPDDVQKPVGPTAIGRAVELASCKLEIRFTQWLMNFFEMTSFLTSQKDRQLTSGLLVKNCFSLKKKLISNQRSTCPFSLSLLCAIKRALVNEGS